jgi:hypothetical protein
MGRLQTPRASLKIARMKKLVVLLAALSVAAPALAEDSKVAPAVVRTPAKAPAAPRAAGTASPRDFQAALAAAAAQGGGDPALDSSLVRVMSQLIAAGRCGEATSLANRDGRKELAARAQQLCK